MSQPGAAVLSWRVDDPSIKRSRVHMSVQMVQAKIKRESVTDAQAAAKKLFAALSDAQPEEIHYVSYLLP